MKTGEITAVEVAGRSGKTFTSGEQRMKFPDGSR